MSQTQEEKVINENNCKFCAKSFPPNELDAHVDKHISDCNTPAVIIRDDKYVPQLMNDYSTCTLYGKNAVLKKFIDIPIPSSITTKNLFGNNEIVYGLFVNSFQRLKNDYYRMMSNNEADILKNKGLFDYQNNALRVMDKIWEIIGFGTYTQRQYESLLKSIKDSI